MFNTQHTKHNTNKTQY